MIFNIDLHTDPCSYLIWVLIDLAMTFSLSIGGVDLNGTDTGAVGVAILHGFLGTVSSFGVGGVGLVAG